jgi:hypothetical protein
LLLADTDVERLMDRVSNQFSAIEPGDGTLI